MIDPHLPLELDDGTPVTLNNAGLNSLNVRIPKSYLRDGSEAPNGGSWNYACSTGVWLGGNAKSYFTLRNANLAPDETEGYFV